MFGYYYIVTNKRPIYEIIITYQTFVIWSCSVILL